MNIKKATRNLFNKGLNRDIDKHQLQNQTLYWNENFRLITQDGESDFLLENVKGNDTFLTDYGQYVQVPSDESIIGHYVFPNKDIVLFVVSKTIVNDYPEISKIYLYKYHLDTEKYYDIITLYTDNNNSVENVGLRLKERINCIGRLETNYVKHLYWTDNENPIKHLNLSPDIDDITNEPKTGIDNLHYTRIQNQPIWMFDFVGKLKHTSIDFKGYSNGELLVGKIQYAVRYFTKHGNSSNYFIDDKLIPIPLKYGNDSLDLEGGDVDKNTHRSVKLTVDVSNNLDYDYFKVYSIHYSSYNSVPTIRAINQYEIKSDTTTVNIIDTGTNYIDEISLDELRLIRSNYIAKTLDRKDDRLFIGNIKETYFDVNYDARTYRFVDDGTGNIRSVVYEKDLTTHRTITSSNWSYVPDDHDCINLFKNHIENDSWVKNNPIWDFKYKSDGVTLGGEGPNVSYSFTNQLFLINKGSISNDGTFVTDDLNNHFLGIYRGFHRDEIYRFGIVFINNRGQESFAKWIGDIRFPTINEYSLNTISGNNVNGNNLYIKFNVQNIPTNPDGTTMEYKIVYVERKEEDKTIIAAGYGGTTVNIHIREETKAGYSYNTPSDFYRFKTNITSDKEYTSTLHLHKGIEFISPNLDINNLDLNDIYLQVTDGRLLYHKYKGITRTDCSDCYLMQYRTYKNDIVSCDNDYYKVDKSLRLQTNEDWKIGAETTYKDGGKKPAYLPHFYRVKEDYNIASFNNIRGVFTFPSIDAKYIPVISDPNISAFGLMYHNMVSPFVLTLEDETLLPDLLNNSRYMYLKRQIIPYNGDDYLTRIKNTYISVSDLTSSSEIIAMYGDTYVGYYDRTRSTLSRNYRDVKWIGKSYKWGSVLWKGKEQAVDGGDILNDKLAQSQGSAENLYMPVETNAVLPFIHGYQSHKHVGDLSSRLTKDKNNKFTITEEVMVDPAEDATNDKKTWVTEVVNYEDMFVYNSVYSKLSTTKLFFPKPFIWEKLKHFPLRIRYSDVKSNGEISDSWLEFRPNNLQDVDAQYGGIEQLVNWKNYLFAFQHRGMCMLPVNERATTSTKEGSQVVLGQGIVLPKVFNYSQGSDKYGLQNNNRVIISEHGLYWIDVIEKKVLIYAGKTQEVNFIKGLSAWLRDNIDGNTKYYGGYDNQFKDVLFSFKNIDENKFNQTLVYNELVRGFQGVYTFFTDRFIMNPMLLSVNDNMIYKHNIGNRTVWYHNNYYSLFKVIVADNTMMTKEFNNLEYMSESYDDLNVDDYYDTLNTIQSENDFLSSEIIELLPFNSGDTLYVGGLNIPNTAPSNIKNIRRRERIWRTTVPRMLSNNSEIDNFRMRDAYVKITGVYRNESNNKFILHPITTYYTMSNIE